MKSLRLETERENLDYVLSNAELTEQEQGDVTHRLTTTAVSATGISTSARLNE